MFNSTVLLTCVAKFWLWGQQSNQTLYLVITVRNENALHQEPAWRGSSSKGPPAPNKEDDSKRNSFLNQPLCSMMIMGRRQQGRRPSPLIRMSWKQFRPFKCMVVPRTPMSCRLLQDSWGQNIWQFDKGHQFNKQPWLTISSMCQLWNETPVLQHYLWQLLIQVMIQRASKDNLHVLLTNIILIAS